jgi:hypothetical protein
MHKLIVLVSDDGVVSARLRTCPPTHVADIRNGQYSQSCSVAANG